MKQFSTARAMLTMVMLGIASMGMLGCGCKKVEQAPPQAPTTTQGSSQTPQAHQDQYLAFIMDGTGFAKDWWQPSLDTATKIMGECATPRSSICVLKVDDYSYEQPNVLMGPLSLPSASLKVHGEVRDLKQRLCQLPAPKPDTIRPGTDLSGAMHLLSDYTGKRPGCWLNLFLFSDLIEEKTTCSYNTVPKLPSNTRIVCMFVARGETESEWLSRQARWKTEMARYGVSESQVFFYDPNESMRANLPTSFFRLFRRPPIAPMALAGDVR